MTRATKLGRDVATPARPHAVCQLATLGPRVGGSALAPTALFMTDEAWMEAVAPEDSLSRFGHRALARRLYAVAGLLPIVAADGELRSVDELACAVHRSLVALDVFQQLVAKDAKVALRRELRLLHAELTRVQIARGVERALVRRAPVPVCVREVLGTTLGRRKRRLWRLWVAVDEGDRLMESIRNVLRCTADPAKRRAAKWSRRELRRRIATFMELPAPSQGDRRALARLQPKARDLEAAVELLGGTSPRAAADALEALRELGARLSLLSSKHRTVRLLRSIATHTPVEQRQLRTLVEDARMARARAAMHVAEWWTEQHLSSLRALLHARPVAARLGPSSGAH